MVDSNRIVSFDILKGGGILLVILGHIQIPYMLKTVIYSFHMPLFFFVSGCFFRPISLREFFAKKTRQLLIPWAFFAFLLFAYLFVLKLNETHNWAKAISLPVTSMFDGFLGDENSFILFHVFTPVYNRKNLIGNLYQSLLSQTYKNFEWIIVDDGSTDDIDEIIKSYQNEDRILIRFIKQENGGKHRAINNGVLHAKGELFYIVDSDDYLTKDSIERIVFHYQYIKNNDKFAGVCGMKCFPDGSRIGKEVTWKILKDSWINYWIIKNIKGDVAFVFKTSVLRNYLFDDIPGEKFCAESLVLNRIGKNYLMLFFNEKIYIAEYLSDGLSVSSIKNRMNSPNYAMRIYSEMASLDIPYLKKIKAHINYWRFAPCSKLKMKNKIKQIGISSYIIFMPIGYLFHMKDKKNNYIDIRHVGSKR